MSAVLLVAVALAVCLVTFVFVRGRSSQAGVNDHTKGAHPPQGSARRGGQPTVSDGDDAAEDAEHDGVVGAGRGRRGEMPKMSRLQRKKLEKEKEKEERRQALAAAQEARARTQEESALKDEEALAKEAERAALEEAALQELREAKKQREDEEYARWVGTMGVEERGELGDEARKRHESMVAHLTERYATVRRHAQERMAREKEDVGQTGAPVGDDDRRAALAAAHQVVLYDTAKQLSVTVEQLVTVIEQLVREETINGVFDEHGKFILLAEEHYPLIAKFIKQRGRVSMSELARECNQIILGS